jgi:hypothetical protein
MPQRAPTIAKLHNAHLRNVSERAKTESTADATGHTAALQESFRRPRASQMRHWNNGGQPTCTTLEDSPVSCLLLIFLQLQPKAQAPAFLFRGMTLYFLVVVFSRGTRPRLVPFIFLFFIIVLGGSLLTLSTHSIRYWRPEKKISDNNNNRSNPKQRLHCGVKEGERGVK